MRRRWAVVAAVVALVALYGIVRAIVWDPNEIAESGPPEPPPLVAGPDYENTAHWCSEATQWRSATTSRAWLGSAVVEGSFTVCIDTVRLLADVDPAGDYYIAVVTSTWRSESASAIALGSSGGVQAPARFELVSPVPAIDNVYDASDLGSASSSQWEGYAGVDVGLDVTSPPAALWGTGGAVIATEIRPDGATWEVKDPQSLDAAIVAFSFKVPNGVVPEVGLAVYSGL